MTMMAFECCVSLCEFSGMLALLPLLLLVQDSWQCNAIQRKIENEEDDDEGEEMFIFGA